MRHGHHGWTRRASRLLSQLLRRQGKHHGCGHPLPHSCVPVTQYLLQMQTSSWDVASFLPWKRLVVERKTLVLDAFSLLSADVPSEVPSEVPSVQAQHTQDRLPERVASCPRAAPPGHTRGELGSRPQGCRQSQEAVAGQAFQGRA